VLGCRAPRFIKPALGRLQVAVRLVALALRLRGNAGKLRNLAIGLAKLSLEMLDPPPQELLLLGNASKLALRILERPSSSFHIGFSRLHGFGSAARRFCCWIRPGKSTSGRRWAGNFSLRRCAGRKS